MRVRAKEIRKTRKRREEAYKARQHGTAPSPAAPVPAAPRPARPSGGRTKKSEKGEG